MLSSYLTHWRRVTHICVSNLIIIGSDNGLPPGQRQAIIWTNAGILLIGHLGTNFSEILFEILTFSFNKRCLNVSSVKWRPCCLGLNVLSVTCSQHRGSPERIQWNIYPNERHSNITQSSMIHSLTYRIWVLPVLWLYFDQQFILHNAWEINTS